MTDGKANGSSDHLLRLLMEGFRSGVFTIQDLIPAADVLLPQGEGSAISLRELEEALKDRHEPELVKLRGLVQGRLVHASFLAHSTLRDTGRLPEGHDFTDLPSGLRVDWEPQPEWPKALHTLLPLLRDLAFVARHKAVPGLETPVLTQWTTEFNAFKDDAQSIAMLYPTRSSEGVDDAMDALRQLPDPISNAIRPDDLLAAIRKRYTEFPDATEHRLLLGLLCNHPNPDAAEEIILRTVSPDDQLWVTRILMARFGQVRQTEWSEWKRWLKRQQVDYRESRSSLRSKIERHGQALSVLKRILAEPDRTMEIVREHGADLAGTLTSRDFAVRWKLALSGDQYKRLLYEETHDEPPPLPDATRSPKAEPSAMPPPLPDALPSDEEEPAREPTPSIWNDHVRPMLAENTYVTAGIAMVLVGTAFLAYYTWDKHWIFRYSIMPLLTGLITFGFGELGRWLERRSAQMREMGILLRGGAIALIPFNFMALCLLAGDPAIQRLSMGLRTAIVAGMGAIYLAVYNLGIFRWCGSVFAELRNYAGWPCALINAHVVVGAIILVNQSGASQTALLVISHSALAIIAVATYAFANGLPRAAVADRWVTGFYGGAVGASLLESVIGLHVFFKISPSPYHFALLLILSGGIILFSESRLFPSAESKPREESFIGFALILAGLLAGMGHEQVRVAAFVTGGVVWLLQARGSVARVHTWIGLTLVTLGAGSIAALKSFPVAAPWNPMGWLGIGVIVFMMVVHQIAKAANRDELATVSKQIQTVLAVMTVGIAALVQWRYQADSIPLATAGILALCALVMAKAARDEQSPRYVHSTMAIAVVVLPYLGCVDMTRPQLTGNVMVFGLALLGIGWIALIHRFPSKLLIDSRSGVLWGLGALAMSAMVLRVVVEREAVAPDAWHRFMDETGPIYMAAVLVMATWYSRSLVPAVMASVILAVLFPELKAQYRQAASALGYGSGFGSAASALGLLLLCIPLSTWSRLRDVPDGDAFMGKIPFPLQRRNSSLFTLPLAATAIFFLVKVCSWNLLRQLWSSNAGYLVDTSTLLNTQLSLKTALSLVFAGLGWFVASVRYRDEEWSKGGIHAAWISMLAGLHWVFLRIEGSSLQYPIAATVIMVVLVVVGCYRLRHDRPWLTDSVLLPYDRLLSVVGPLGAFITTAGLCFRFGPNKVWLLIPLFLGLSAYYGWTRKNILYGYATVVLAVAATLSATLTSTPLWANGPQTFILPTLVILLAIHLLLVWRERMTDDWFDDTSWLMVPARRVAMALLWVVVLRWLGCWFRGRIDVDFGSLGVVLLCIVSILAMRGSASLMVGLWFCLFAHGTIVELVDDGDMNAFFSPSRLGVVACTMALLVPVIRVGFERYPKLFLPRGVDAGNTTAKRRAFLVVTSLVCLVAALAQGAYAFFDPKWTMLGGCYLAAGALLLIYWWWPGKAFAVISMVFEVLANVGLAHFLYLRNDPEALSRLGITGFHVLALGMLFAALQQALKWQALAFAISRPTERLRALPQDAWASYVTAVIDRLRRDQVWFSRLWSTTARGLITSTMLFLTLNYVVRPGVQNVSWVRYAISGSIALAVAVYFRFRARSKGGSGFDVAMYHYAASMTMWCMVLMIPAMRTPSWAFLTFSIAPLFFWFHAERHRSNRADVAREYGRSSLLLIFILYVLYAYSPLFDVLVYRGEPLAAGRLAWHYHANAPFVLLLSLVALRLHAIVRTWWAPLYSGVIAMIMTLFLATWVRFPTFSPFRAPLNAAWTTILFAHLWLLLINRPTPVRLALTHLAKITDDTLKQTVRIWSGCLALLCLGMTAYGAVNYGTRPKEVALLLCATITVLVHYAVVERAFAVVPIAVSGLLALLALHMGFIVPSHLPKDQVVWALAAIWAAGLGVSVAVRDQRIPPAVNYAAQLFGVLVFTHLLFVQHPETRAGLLAFAALATLAALSPVAKAEEPQPNSLILTAAPVWLAFFSQSSFMTGGIQAFSEVWPYLTGGALAYGIAFLSLEWHEHGNLASVGNSKLIHRTLRELKRHGLSVSKAYLGLLLLIQGYGLFTILNMDLLDDVRTIVLCGLLFPLAGHTWYRLGRLEHCATKVAVAEAHLFGMVLVIRHVLWLSGSWNVYYDVWTAIALSFMMTAMKQIWDTRPEEERRPAYWTIWTLPIITLAWALFKNLGTDTVLIIIALHSLMFAYLGGSRRDSPYHAIAVSGFVSFLLILLARLEFRVVNAYVIPVSLGCLTLLQLFRDSMDAEERNRIRTVCLVAMIGSSAWYALIGEGYPIAFNLTLIVVCLLAMVIGSVLRIRIYVLLGFVGLMTDLVSLLYKGIRKLEKNYQMASIGGLLLFVGVGVVAGAAWCRVNRDKIQLWTNKLKDRLGRWE